MPWFSSCWTGCGGERGGALTLVFEEGDGWECRARARGPPLSLPQAQQSGAARESVRPHTDDASCINPRPLERRRPKVPTTPTPTPTATATRKTLAPNQTTKPNPPLTSPTQPHKHPTNNPHNTTNKQTQQSLFFRREMELSLVGLQNAGKSSLVGVLTTGRFQGEDTIPTVGFNMRKVTKGGVTIKMWDLGGQVRAQEGRDGT
jgi:hypothetical protein